MIAKALTTLRPQAQWVLRGDDYSGLEWLDTEQTKPTSEEIEVEIQRLNAEYTSTQYKRDRSIKYPAIGDQLDALFHAGVFPADMAAKIQAVKDTYPKG